MSSEEAMKRSLAARIAAISAEIGAVAKSGRNAQQGYAYIEYAAVAAEIRKLQQKHGVAIVPRVESYEKDQVSNSRGGAGYHYLLNMVFTIINTDDADDRIESRWVGESTDYGDKGINKAVTSAVKYFIMRLYNISERGEKEADAETPEMVAQPKPAEHKVDFSEVREKLKTIDSIDGLNAYWVELHLSANQAKSLMKDFASRKEELGDE